MTMGKETSSTFSRRRRWSARFAVLVSSICVLAIVAMVNYASQRYFSKRFFLSSQSEVRLSEQTLGLLRSLTNDVEVIMYYDRDEPMYPTISALLNEYRLACPKIQVRTVDYVRDPADAAEVKIKYGLDSLTEKNLVIFDSGGRDKVVPGTMLAEYALEQIPNAEEREFRKKPVLFMGEQVFSAVLLALSNPKPLKAYFLGGHGEHAPDGGDPQMGYMKFTSLLQQNYVQVQPLSLLGTNRVPDDCNLLIIAGPVQPLAELEVQRIANYLEQGGRLLALLSYQSADKRLGLEPLLEQWGVKIGPGLVRDPDNTSMNADVLPDDFGSHPIMNPLLKSRLHMMLPRPVGPTTTNAPDAGAPAVDVLIRSGPNSVILPITGAKPGPQPLGVAVERAEAKGVVTERGASRLVVLGDSIFLGNEIIDSMGNRDFASSVINWLLDRTALMQGVGPRKVTEYRLVMTESQYRRIQWLLLGGLPAGVLLLGGIVWLTRRS
jgi:hypothetical protein